MSRINVVVVGAETIMPTPRTDESEADFVKRCVPDVIADESAEDNKQAVAMCHSMWDEGQQEAGRR